MAETPKNSAPDNKTRCRMRFVLYKFKKSKWEGDVEDKIIKETSPKKKRVKTWGDEGFIGKVHYGCFDYDVRFVPQDEIKQKIDSEEEATTIFGAINQFEQMIYIASDSSPQCQRATLLHELVHAVFLQNSSSLVGDEQVNIQSELVVDRTANGIFEILRRNPEVLKWLTK